MTLVAPAALLERVQLKFSSSVLTGVGVGVGFVVVRGATNFRGAGLETPSISQPAPVAVRIHRHLNVPIVLRLLTSFSSTLMWAPALASVGSRSRMKRPFP